MARPRLTDQQIDRLVLLRERGWSYDAIGKELGRSGSAIMYHCLRLGVLSPRQRWQPAPTAALSHVGFGGTCRRFTCAEDQELLRLESEGLASDAIAARMGRARTSVRMRLMRLALRDELVA